MWAGKTLEFDIRSQHVFATCVNVQDRCRRQHSSYTYTLPCIVFFFFVKVYQGKEFSQVTLMVLLLGTFLMMKEQAYHK